MESKRVFKDFVATVRKILKKDLRVSLPGIGTLTVVSVPSRSESLGPDKFSIHPPNRNILLESDVSESVGESFVAEFASDLGVSPEQSEAVISVLSKELIGQMPVAIDGLGTFSKSHDGFSFSADTDLIKFIFGHSLEITPVEIKDPPPASSPSKRPSHARKRTAWPLIAIPTVLVLIIASYFLIPRITEFTNQAIENAGPSDIDTTEAPPTETEEFISNLGQFFDTEAEPSQDEASSEISPSSEDMASQSEEPSDTNPVVEDPPETPSSDTNPPATETPANVPAPSREFPTLDRQLGGYTLVIASFNVSSRALTVVEQYRRIYPAIPVDTLIGTNNRFRVTIGQVSTIPEAVFLKENLSEIPPDSWVMNILDF